MSHGPLKLIRKRRPIQTAIEGAIRGIAFLSFAAIILIFVFVFREALPMFSSRGEQKPTVDTSAAAVAALASEMTPSVTPGGAPTMAAPISKEKFKAATKVETKVDASGKKIKVTKEGGSVEQEVYDPLADDEPAAIPEKPITKPVEKPIAKVKSDTAKLAANDTTKAKKKPATLAAASAAKVDTSKPPAVAAPIVDSASLRFAKAHLDSMRLAEAKEIEEKNHLTDVNHLAQLTWQPVSTVPKYGLTPLFIGTLKVTLISILFGGPLAILAALFSSTFAPRRLREFIKPAIELLAGFPSVVIGFFALIVMATVFQNFFGYQYRLNSFLGGIAMSFAIIPIIYTISEDALISVPQSLKDASDALGAAKWQTAFRVVLPAAIPGVFAALVLGFGRAFGETMIALMATGNAPLSNLNIFEPVRTFSATIGAEMAEVVFGDQHYNVLFFIGSLLFVFTFTMNSLVEFWIRKRLIKRIQGA